MGWEVRLQKKNPGCCNEALFKPLTLTFILIPITPEQKILFLDLFPLAKARQIQLGSGQGVPPTAATALLVTSAPRSLCCHG